MKFSSIGAAFKSQLGALMAKLNETEPHYIRCIKPNGRNVPSAFENANVLHQLRCGGVLEAVSISCAGYPSRKPVDEFLDRFGLLAPDKEALFTPGEETEVICHFNGREARRSWQLGKTKVFLRAGQMASLDMIRHKRMTSAATFIQKMFRVRAKRRRYEAREQPRCASRSGARHARASPGGAMRLERAGDQDARRARAPPSRSAPVREGSQSDDAHPGAPAAVQPRRARGGSRDAPRDGGARKIQAVHARM